MDIVHHNRSSITRVHHLMYVTKQEVELVFLPTNILSDNKLFQEGPNI